MLQEQHISCIFIPEDDDRVVVLGTARTRRVVKVLPAFVTITEKIQQQSMVAKCTNERLRFKSQPNAKSRAAHNASMQ